MAIHVLLKPKPKAYLAHGSELRGEEKIQKVRIIVILQGFLEIWLSFV